MNELNMKEEMELALRDFREGLAEDEVKGTVRLMQFIASFYQGTIDMADEGRIEDTSDAKTMVFGCAMVTLVEVFTRDPFFNAIAIHLYTQRGGT